MSHQRSHPEPDQILLHDRGHAILKWKRFCSITKSQFMYDFSDYNNLLAGQFVYDFLTWTWLEQKEFLLMLANAFLIHLNYHPDQAQVVNYLRKFDDPITHYKQAKNLLEKACGL